MAFGRLSSFVTETGADSTNLGRLTHLKISNAYKTVRVVWLINHACRVVFDVEEKSEREEQYGSNMIDILERMERKETH